MYVRPWGRSDLLPDLLRVTFWLAADLQACGLSGFQPALHDLHDDLKVQEVLTQAPDSSTAKCIQAWQRAAQPRPGTVLSCESAGTRSRSTSGTPAVRLQGMREAWATQGRGVPSIG